MKPGFDAPAIAVLLAAVCAGCGSTRLDKIPVEPWQQRAATTVEIVDGQRLQGSFVVTPDEVRLEDGTTVSRTKVRQILYGVSGGDTGRTATAATGVEDLRRLAAEAAAFEAKYPDVGGITLLADAEYLYRTNGTWVLTARNVSKVKKEDHKSLADRTLVFTEGRERARLLTARCLTSSGEVFQANFAETKITKPQLSPGMFVKHSVASVRIPGVEAGSIVETVSEADTYNPYNREFFFPVSYFQGRDPVFHVRLTVLMPKDKPLFWEARNFPPGKDKPVESDENGFRKYQWELREVPPLIPEPLMPKGADAVPYVQGALFEGWDKVYDWINVYWKTNTTPSSDLVNLVREIVKDAATDDEKVARLYHWIQKNIRYIIVKGDAETIYGSYPAHETVARQFGCCVDKAMVFSGMLNAIGIKNGPILINVASHDMSPRIANLHITHSITRVSRADGSKYYLDSTGYDHRYPSMGSLNQGRHCLDPFDRSFDFIPMQRPEDNQSMTVATLSLYAGGNLQVRVERSFTGDQEAAARQFLKSLKPSEREKHYQNQVNSYGKGAILDSFHVGDPESLEKPLAVVLTYHIPSYPREIADLAIFQVPGFLEALKFPEMAVVKRSYPIEYESTESHVDQGTIAVPEGWRVRSLPEPLEIRNRFFAFSGSFTAAGDREVVYRGRFDRLVKKVSLEDMAVFRDGIEKVERFKKDSIFLVRRPEGGDKGL